MFGRVLFRILFVVVLFFMFAFWGSLTRLDAQPTPPPYDPDAIPLPLQKPVAALGGALYPENCAPCHGETGQGDGPTAVDLQVKPTAFADPSIIWTRSPAELFHTTKYGRMESLMPPWRNQMSDGEIWDTVYYAWGLHTNQVEIEAGGELYVENCASCHGETGAGDGPDAEGEMLDLSDGTRLMVLSPAALDQGWRDAHPEAGEAWSAEDRGAVLNYIRTFSYVPPWESPFQAGNGVVEGALIQGTPDGGSPAGLDVQLRAFMDFTEVETFETTADEQGRFRFEALATGENMVYALGTSYDGVSYGSDFFRIDPLNPRQLVDVTVYEPSDDDSGVAIARTNWVLDFEPGAMVVGQIATFGNNSDRTFIGKQVEGIDLPVTVALNVPSDAEGISFRDGSLGTDYFQDGDIIYDTAPILPGVETRQLVASYRIPLDRDGSGNISQEFLYAVGEVNLLVADLPDLEATVEGLTSARSDTIQGMDYRIWSSADLASGDVVSVDVAGALVAGDVDPRALAGNSPSEEAVGPTQTADPLEPIVPIALGALLVLALAGVFVWSVRNGTEASTGRSLAADKEMLIRRIAALDDRHASGELDDETWSSERAGLKRQLLIVAQQLDAGQNG